MSYLGILLSLMYPFIAAVAYVLTGYLKNPENVFNLKKAVYTLVLSIVVGVIVVVGKLSPDAALQLATTSGFFTVLIENIVKAIVRRVRAKKKEI